MMIIIPLLIVIGAVLLSASILEAFDPFDD